MLHGLLRPVLVAVMLTFATLPASAQSPETASTSTAPDAYDAALDALETEDVSTAEAIALVRRGVAQAHRVLDSSGVSLAPAEMQTFLDQRQRSLAFLDAVDDRFGGWLRTALDDPAMSAAFPAQNLAGMTVTDLLALPDDELARRLLAP